MNNGAWNDERIARLKELWWKGVTGSKIAADLGPPFTRCSVLAKAHRLNLEPRSVQMRTPPTPWKERLVRKARLQQALQSTATAVSVA